MGIVTTANPKYDVLILACNLLDLMCVRFRTLTEAEIDAQLNAISERE